MTDPGKLYDWLDGRNIGIVQWDDEGTGKDLTREEWERVFREYEE